MKTCNVFAGDTFKIHRNGPPRYFPKRKTAFKTSHFCPFTKGVTLWIKLVGQLRIYCEHKIFTRDFFYVGRKRGFGQFFKMFTKATRGHRNYFPSAAIFAENRGPTGVRSSPEWKSIEYLLIQSLFTECHRGALQHEKYWTKELHWWHWSDEQGHRRLKNPIVSYGAPLANPNEPHKIGIVQQLFFAESLMTK